MGVDATMRFSTTEELSDRQLIRKGYEIFGVVHHDTFWVDRPGEMRSVRRVFSYDEGRKHIEVSLRGRYYGKGYERGSLFDYIQIAEWIERNFDEARVEYGSDHYDGYDDFGAEGREEFIKHWASPDGANFHRSGFGSASAPECDLCLETMTQYGQGPSYSAFRCPCGLRVETRDGGKAYVVSSLNDNDKGKPWPPIKEDR